MAARKCAPAQRMIDFIEGGSRPTCRRLQLSAGHRSHRVDELLPRDIAERLQLGLRAFSDARCAAT